MMARSPSSWLQVVWTTFEIFSPEQMIPAFTVPASMRWASMIMPSLNPMQALVMSSTSDSSGMPRLLWTRQAVAGSKKSRDTEQLMSAPIWSGRNPERSRASRAATVATELGVTSVDHMPRVLTPLTRSSVPAGIFSRS